jgi:hypothetical protein
VKETEYSLWPPGHSPAGREKTAAPLLTARLLVSTTGGLLLSSTSVQVPSAVLGVTPISMSRGEPAATICDANRNPTVVACTGDVTFTCATPAAEAA